MTGGEFGVSPPGPPDVTRRLSVPWYQWLSVAAIAMFPVLSIAGVFGESSAESSGSAGVIDVLVEYPTRLRYNLAAHFELRLRNDGASVVDSVIVSFDREYADAFGAITSIPRFRTPYEIVVGDLRPGETRFVTVDAKALKYWRRHGAVTVSVAPEQVKIPLTTLIFP